MIHTLPHATAGPIFHAQMSRGKFHCTISPDLLWLTHRDDLSDYAERFVADEIERVGTGLDHLT
jgi:hypothetical protein